MKDLFGTVGTRYLVAFLNVALLFVHAKVLGAEGLGTVGLIVAVAGIVTMFCGILAGNTIVYFMNRYAMSAVFLLAYGWIPLGAGIACAVLELFALLPEGYVWDVYFLAVLTSLVAANSRFLLGQNRLTAFNLSFFLQGGMLFFILIFFYYGLGRQEVDAFLYGVYLANGIAFVYSFFSLFPLLREGREKPTLGLLKEMLRYGLWGSADNVAEILTTRLNYFLIKRFAGVGSVGLLEAGTKVSESVWHINRSIGFLTYSRVARSQDCKEQKEITLRFFKLTLGAVSLAVGAILMIPEWVYTDYLFTPEFKGMRQVVVGLAAGIIAMACNGILSQYFIGSGQIRYSAYSSFCGLFSLLVSGFFLIPAYGIFGAAVCSSIAFFFMLACSVFFFCRQTESKLADFIICKADLSLIKSKIKR